MKNAMQKRFGWLGSFFFLLIPSLLMLAGCHPLQKMEADEIEPYDQNFEIIGPEKDELIGKVNPAIFTTVDRSNDGAEQVESDVYTNEGVKVALQPGRYMISGSPAGNIFIYDDNGDLVIR